MTLFRRKGEKPALRYSFVASDCIGAACWAPGLYQHRGATMSGSRNTGAASPCCMNNAYHGCPSNVVKSEDLARKRRAEGWVRA